MKNFERILRIILSLKIGTSLVFSSLIRIIKKVLDKFLRNYITRILWTTAVGFYGIGKTFTITVFAAIFFFGVFLIYGCLRLYDYFDKKIDESIDKYSYNPQDMWHQQTF